MTTPRAGEPLDRLFPGDSEMARRMRALDWAATDLGSPSSWPENLRTAVSICLTSRFPIVLWWGPDLTLLYNDGYVPMLGPGKHPHWLGRSGRECWSEIWDTVGPMLDGVMRSGRATWSEDLLLLLNRHVPREECYFTFSYSPILAGDGSHVDGIFCAVTETTEYVVGRRRLQTLREVGRRTAKVDTPTAACHRVVEVLGENPDDVPFAALYLVDRAHDEARLCGAVGTGEGLPERVALERDDGGARWPIAAVWTARATRELSLAPGDVPSNAPTRAPLRTALAIPVVVPGVETLGGVLVVGVNPHRLLDRAYRDFFRAIAAQIGTAVAESSAWEAERTRAEMLAELDRAKTAFFSNVSHEFRTPLTLMLGPLESALAAGDALPQPHRAGLRVAHRNSQRLLRLVNTLLDFSRIEAGRVDAVYEPVDIAEITADLASVFRSAIERAGLAFDVRCEAPAASVFVDRDMWEKVVLNLLSNAFKFTLQGGISLSLTERDGAVELCVSDTGAGIPPDELPHVFERFHRVRGTEGRTHEGTGIGLALVSELVKLHGGHVDVESTPGVGSTFTVRIPTGCAHLPAERIGAARTRASTALGAAPFVDEALRWLPDAAAAGDDTADGEDAAVGSAGARVLVADDNADMRAYVARLLRTHWVVDEAADGARALETARARRPDLILSDVMMPRLDGFGLVRAIRADPELADIPVILLSARAGEEARVDGLASGADDYVTKPFVARELVARVDAHLSLARLRRETLTEQRRLAEELRVQGAHLRAVLDAAPLAIWVARDVDCRVIEGNPFANALLGIAGGNVSLNAPPEARAITVRHVHGGIELEPHELPLQRAMATGQALVANEYTLVLPDGRRIHALISAVPMLGDDGRVIGGVAAGVDITARHRTERVLRAQRRALELAVAGASLDHVLDVVVRAAEAYVENGARGMIVLSDRADARAATGPAAPVTSRLPIVSAGGTVLGSLVIRRARASNDPPDTVPLHLLAHTAAVLLERHRTLEARDRAEAALAQRSAQLEALLEAAPLGVYLVDADFRIRAVNPVARTVFGDIPDLDGRDFDEVIHILWSTEYADELVGIVRHTLDTGDPYFMPERIEQRRDRGVTEIYEWQMHRIPLADGRFGVVCYFRDISAQVAARERILASEEAARQAQQEAEAANRAKDEFLATVSHELRSPLQGILGWLTLLKRGRLDATQTSRALEAVERSVRLQAQLVYDIMDISRIVAGKAELERAPLDLAALLGTTIDEFLPGAVAKGLSLEFHAEHCGLVLGDRERLHQVFSNLLTNALKFTASGGRVRVSCGRDGESLVVAVADTGDGIPPEFLPRLFDRFTQADSSSTRRYGGLGLGLAIVRHLVELHGGTVSAESDGPGRGATFRVRLPPMRADAAVPSRRAAAPAALPRLDGVDILLVEDDGDALEAMRLTLESIGATVRPAASAGEAWDAFVLSPPDVVVSDLGMPDEDGYSLLQRIRAADGRSGVPTIAMTGFTRPEDRARVLAAGFVAHIAKPIDPDDLVRVLADVLEDRRRPE